MCDSCDSASPPPPSPSAESEDLTAGPLNDLLNGFERFRRTYLHGEAELFDRLVQQGQAPKAMLIGCSDSRVDPAILTHCEPGDLFIVRNVAAIVPPRDADGHHHGTSSAIEFGVRGLKVRHIIVLGHAFCGGVKALARESDPQTARDYEFLDDWVAIVRPARDQVWERFADLAEVHDIRRLLEQATVLQSVANLFTFPWLRERLEQGLLSVHAWYFDLSERELFVFDAVRHRFRSLANPLAPCETERRLALLQGVRAPDDLALERFLDAEEEALRNRR